MRALLLPAALLVAATFASPASAAPERIGVVDLLRLVSNHPGLKVAQQAFNRRTSDAKEAFNKEIEALKKEDSEIAPDSQDNPQTKGKRRRIELQNLTAKFQYDASIKDARELYVRDLEAVYANVKSVIAQYARENGYALILQKSDDPLSPDDPNEFVVKVAMRGVVFYEESLDVTKNIEALFPKPPPPPVSPR